MLLRIDALQEIGRFSSLKHKAPQFSRLTLVFARNGYGKSTIAAVMRSASENEPKYILARRRLGAKKESYVRTNWQSGTDAVFLGGKWDRRPSKAFIFDQEFVFQNLHVGDSVTRENMRSLLPVVLGKTGVELSRKIIELDREQRELDTVMKGLSTRILAKCSGIAANEIPTFCSKAVPDDIELRIEKASRSLELAKQAIAVKQTKNPKPIPIEDLGYFVDIIERTIDKISLDVADKIRAHFKKHNLAPNGDRWLKYGLDHATDACPFCDQSLKGVALIDAYKAYFSEAFAALTAARDSAIESIRSLRSTIASLLDENTRGLDFWITVCDLPAKAALSEADRATINKGMELLGLVFDQKVARPLEAISLESNAPAIEAAFSLVKTYNDGISECNATINDARVEAAKVDLAKVTEIHQKWIALKEKTNEPVKSAVADYIAAESRRRQVVKEKETAQADLKTFAETNVALRQSEINEILTDFGANFTITDTKANFVGRDPNAEYSIFLSDRKIKVGAQSDAEPSFKTVLSAGDKTTLALAFFLSQVRSDQELADSVVVFDDPFNSQDMHRQFETTSRIRDVASRALQTIVFSHDPRFLELIERNADASITTTFQLACAKTGDGHISPWSAADELKELYVTRAAMIREYASLGKLLKGVTEVMLVQAMRPFLEDYLRARYPSRFGDKEFLHDMATAIGKAGVDDPMYGSVADLLAINEYTRPEHHGGGKAPDPTELRAQSKKIFRMIGSY